MPSRNVKTDEKLGLHIIVKTICVLEWTHRQLVVRVNLNSKLTNIDSKL